MGVFFSIVLPFLTVTHSAKSYVRNGCIIKLSLEKLDANYALCY